MYENQIQFKEKTFSLYEYIFFLPLIVKFEFHLIFFVHVVGFDIRVVIEFSQTTSTWVNNMALKLNFKILMALWFEHFMILQMTIEFVFLFEFDNYDPLKI